MRSGESATAGPSPRVPAPRLSFGNGVFVDLQVGSVRPGGRQDRPQRRRGLAGSRRTGLLQHGIEGLDEGRQREGLTGPFHIERAAPEGTNGHPPRLPCVAGERRPGGPCKWGRLAAARGGLRGQHSDMSSDPQVQEASPPDLLGPSVAPIRSVTDLRPGFRQIILATDMGPASAAATDAAFRLAGALGARLLAVSAIDPRTLQLPGGRFRQPGRSGACPASRPPWPSWSAGRPRAGRCEFPDLGGRPRRIDRRGGDLRGCRHHRRRQPWSGGPRSSAHRQRLGPGGPARTVPGHGRPTGRREARLTLRHQPGPASSGRGSSRRGPRACDTGRSALADLTSPPRSWPPTPHGRRAEGCAPWWSTSPMFGNTRNVALAIAAGPAPRSRSRPSRSVPHRPCSQPTWPCSWSGVPPTPTACPRPDRVARQPGGSTGRSCRRAGDCASGSPRSARGWPGRGGVDRAMEGSQAVRPDRRRGERARSPPAIPGSAGSSALEASSSRVRPACSSTVFRRRRPDAAQAWGADLASTGRYRGLTAAARRTTSLGSRPGWTGRLTG